MNNKVAGTIATLMALFFLYATLNVADQGMSGAALIGTLIFAVLVAVAAFAFAQDARDEQPMLVWGLPASRQADGTRVITVDTSSDWNS